MFRRRRPAPVPDAAADLAVWAAEEIVRDAWALELARESLHKRSLAAGRAHRVFLAEMEALDRASAVRATARGAQQPEQDEAAVNAEPCEPTARVDRVVVVKPGLRQRIRRWSLDLIGTRSAA
jgi:hypothetical protein